MFLRNKVFMLPLFLIIATFFLSVGYARVNNLNFDVSGTLEAIISEDIYILDVVSSDINSAVVENYDQTLLVSKIILDEHDIESTKSFNITLFNNTKNKQFFEEVKYQFGIGTYDNENIDFILSGLSEGDEIDSLHSKTFTITFKYSDNYKNEVSDNLPEVLDNELNSIVNFYFGYLINFVKGHGDTKPNNYYLPSGGSLNEITSSIPKRTGYVFMGWYDNEDYTKGQMFYDENQFPSEVLELVLNNYSVNLYAGWKPITYVITYHDNLYMSNDYSNVNDNISLPNGYQRLLYISSDGNQYIDTGFIPNQDTRVIFDGEITENKPSDGEKFHTLYGCDNNNYKVDSFGAWFNDTNYSYNGVIQYGNQSIFGTNIKLNAELNRRFISDSNKNNYSWHYYGEDNIEYSKTFTYTNFSAVNSLYLLTLNREGGSHNSLITIGGVIGKIYNAKIYDDGVLVRNFIPCYYIKDGIAGLYDIVNNKFYENKGTGNFEFGPYISKTVKEYGIKYNELYTIKNNIFDRDNYVITSWNTKSDGSGKTYNINDSVSKLTDVNNDNINLYAIWKFSLDPTKYIRLDYLRTNGNQYIDTGFIPNQDTRVVYDGEITENKIKVSNELFHTLYGCDDNGYNNKSFGAWFNDTNYSYNGVIQYGNQSIFGTNIKLNAELNRRFISDSNKNNYSWHYYGEENIEYSKEFTYTNFSAVNTLYLFNLNRNGSAHNNLLTMGGVIGKFYNAKIYNNSFLIRNYIPCMRVSDNKYGLLDIVNNEFHLSEGTQDFFVN